VQDRVCFVWLLLQFLDGVRRRQDEQFDLRRWAWRFTSAMTGNAPVPVPITRRRHFQGMFPAIRLPS
jgi:hypothetical protein